MERIALTVAEIRKVIGRSDCPNPRPCFGCNYHDSMRALQFLLPLMHVAPGINDYTTLVNRLRDDAAQILFEIHPESRPGAVRDLLMECAATVSRQELEIALLRVWKTEQQSSLIKMAVELLDAGFHGDGVLEGVQWLSKKVKAVAKQYCDKPPAGWMCTRSDPNHDGPCAAVRDPDYYFQPGVPPVIRVTLIIPDDAQMDILVQVPPFENETVLLGNKGEFNVESVKHVIADGRTQEILIYLRRL